MFDKDRDEFVIHSPSDAATKWWIGMAGKTATHTVALAQLIIDDTRHGLHWFIVPLRHVDGRCVEGVECGDVGAISCPKHMSYSVSLGYRTKAWAPRP